MNNVSENGDEVYGGGFVILVRVARKGCAENMSFEQRPE